eukprot:1682437-Ditylum_brightwellii.AAC.1
MGSSALRNCICIKYASVKLHFGHTVAVRSTFSQAEAPPKMSSTTFLFVGCCLLETGMDMGWQYGQVGHRNIDLEDVEVSPVE